MCLFSLTVSVYTWFVRDSGILLQFLVRWVFLNSFPSISLRAERHRIWFSIRGGLCVKFQDHVPRMWRCMEQTFCSRVLSRGDVVEFFVHIGIYAIPKQILVTKAFGRRICSMKSFAYSVVGAESRWLAHKSALQKPRPMPYQRSCIDMYHRSAILYRWCVPSSSRFIMSMPGFYLKIGNCLDRYARDNWKVLHDEV